MTTNVGLESLTNDQGGNDALKLDGYLPVNYVFLANSTTDYGKLAVDNQNGATTLVLALTPLYQQELILYYNWCI